MLKAVLATITVLTLSTASLVYAQQSAPPGPPRSRPNAEDSAAFTDARIAALRAGLKLSSEQEKHWGAVEAAIRELAKQRATQRTAWRDARASGTPPARPDAIERLRRGSDRMTAQAAALKQLADAAEPLYNSLDDDQKRRFSVLLRMGGRNGQDGGPPRWQRRG